MALIFNDQKEIGAATRALAAKGRPDSWPQDILYYTRDDFRRRFEPAYARQLLQIGEKDFSSGRFAAKGVAGVRRYQEGSMVYTDEDLDDARSLCEELLSWSRGIIES